MGMPVTVEIVDRVPGRIIDMTFDLFTEVDRRFSPYRPDSELRRHERGEIPARRLSAEMREILALARRTREATRGYFDIQRPDGSLDPSGIVKGWAIRKAADHIRAAGSPALLRRRRRRHPVQPAGTRTARPGPSASAIRSTNAIIKVVAPRGHGVATSGTYVRGQHIYDPHRPHNRIDDIVSLTVIGAGRARGRSLRDCGLRHGAGRHPFHRGAGRARRLPGRQIRHCHADHRLQGVCAVMKNPIDHFA